MPANEVAWVTIDGAFFQAVAKRRRHLPAPSCRTAARGELRSTAGQA